MCTSFKNIQSGTSFLESGCWQDDVWSAIPFIPPSGKEHTFSIYHVLFSFSLKNMWISGNNIRVQMFYFDSNTTVPLQCVALVVWKSLCWQFVMCIISRPGFAQFCVIIRWRPGTWPHSPTDQGCTTWSGLPRSIWRETWGYQT